MVDQKLMTKVGLANLKKDLVKLENRRPGAVERVEAARQMGDLRENSEYHAAREDLTLLDTQVDELKEILVNVKVVTGNNNGNNQIGLGNLVTVENNGQKINYHLVGEHESDPVQKKISYTSPLGQALMNRKVNDKVIAKTPRGKIEYLIIAIK